MATFGSTVNRIANTIRSQNKDARVPKRYILSVLQSKLEFLIAQKLHDRSLFREDGLYTHVPCIELEKWDVHTCDIIEFRSCNKMMKGTKKLPSIINSRFGPAIKNVTNIDGTKEYIMTTPTKYRNSKLREERIRKKYYYLKDNCPVLLDSDVERIDMDILTLEPYLLSEISECVKDKCKSYWDYDLPTSDKITDIAIQETLKELGFMKQITPDTNPNMDENQKGKTTV